MESSFVCTPGEMPPLLYCYPGDSALLLRAVISDPESASSLIAKLIFHTSCVVVHSSFRHTSIGHLSFAIIYYG